MTDESDTMRTAVDRALAAGFLLTLFAVPAVQHAAEIARPDPVRGRLPQCYDVFRAIPSLRKLKVYEAALEERSVAAAAVRPLARYALTGLLRAGGEEACVGRGGWLFYRPGVDYLTRPPFMNEAWLRKRVRGTDAWKAPPQPDALRCLLGFHRQLAERGIALVLVPAPSKAMIHPEKLSGRYGRNAPLLQNPSYARFRRALKAEGMFVFDPAAALRRRKLDTGRPQYLAADTHWTPEAVEHAAEGLAEFLRAHIALSPGRADAWVRTPAQVANPGDIAAMLKLPEGHRLFPPETVRIQQVAAPNGTPWRPFAGAEVLLLGDSFSNVYSLGAMGLGERAGLAEQLAFALGLPVDRIAVNAGGAHAARLELGRDLAAGRDRLAGKRVVVYQFAVRELTSGDWKLLDLPRPEAAQAPSRQGRVVRGVIREISRPPRPWEVTYRDCRVAIHLADVRTGGGTRPAGEMLVYVWGMRDGRWTPAAHFRTGRSVTVRVTPWAEAPAFVRQSQAVELDEAILLDAWWGEPAADE